MRLKVFFLLLVTLLLASCGSKRQIVTKRTPKPVIVEEPREDEVAVPTIKPNKKKKKFSKKTYTETTVDYIEKFAPIAVKEMHKYKIPASITLAQGILESGSGRSNLSVRSNNHFGIKCHRGWKGKSVTHDDDRKGECFRKYKYPEESYEDHSTFLTTRKRYAKLFKLRSTDYRGWAYGLKRAGYATDRKYPNKLIALIEKFDLDKYDRGDKEIPKKIEKQNPVVTNYPKQTKDTNPVPNTTEDATNTRFYYKVIKGDTLYSISRKFKVSLQKLKELNSLTTNNISIGQELILK